MSNTSILLNRNHQFSKNFTEAELPVLPKLRTVILACGDSRVDPAHIFGLELGDAVVIRNNGGRVTQEVINEIIALTFMVAKMDGEKPGPFELILLQHTQCGAERFADPNFQRLLKEQVGVDVSSSAIANHEESLLEDIERLISNSMIPSYVLVSAYIYDVKTGIVHEVVSPKTLRQH